MVDTQGTLEAAAKAKELLSDGSAVWYLFLGVAVVGGILFVLGKYVVNPGFQIMLEQAKEGTKAAAAHSEAARSLEAASVANKGTSEVLQKTTEQLSKLHDAAMRALERN